MPGVLRGFCVEMAGLFGIWQALLGGRDGGGGKVAGTVPVPSVGVPKALLLEGHGTRSVPTTLAAIASGLAEEGVGVVVVVD